MNKSLLMLLFFTLVGASCQVLMRWGGVAATRANVSLGSPLQWLWTSRWWLAGLLTSWVCGVGYAWTLRHRQLSLPVCNSIYAGLGYALTVALSAMILHERLTLYQWLGVACVMGGILLITLRTS